MTVFEPVSSECFRVDSRRLFRGLEPENTIFVVLFRACRVRQGRPGASSTVSVLLCCFREIRSSIYIYIYIAVSLHIPLYPYIDAVRIYWTMGEITKETFFPAEY